MSSNPVEQAGGIHSPLKTVTRERRAPSLMHYMADLQSILDESCSADPRQHSPSRSSANVMKDDDRATHSIRAKNSKFPAKRGCTYSRLSPQSGNSPVAKHVKSDTTPTSPVSGEILEEKDQISQGMVECKAEDLLWMDLEFSTMRERLLEAEYCAHSLIEQNLELLREVELVRGSVRTEKHNLQKPACFS